VRISILVADSGPLITLAAAGELDLLTKTGARLIIPDMILIEATRDMLKPGAYAIQDWAANAFDITFVPTRIALDYSNRLAADPKFRGNNYGEYAAREVLNKQLARDPLLKASLIYEDGRVASASFRATVHTSVDFMTTHDFLVAMELEGVIPSASDVFDRAQAAMPARNVNRLRKLTDISVKPAPLKE
jgi:hypothetical protein